MFRRKDREKTNSICIYSKYEHVYLTKFEFYIKKDNTIKQHVYPYKLAVKIKSTFLGRIIFSVLLFLIMIPLFLIGVIVSGKKAFNLKQYLKLDFVEDLWELAKGAEDVCDPLQRFMIPIDVPEVEYKHFVKECVKIFKNNTGNGKETLADYSLGISILAMENIGMELSDYWKNIKKEIIDKMEERNGSN